VTLPPDQPTRDLVSLKGLDQTLFVEAGAGSGKTTQLVQRIVNLVLVKRVRLLNVAAITFTEAAAAELQSRIRVEFEKRAADSNDAEVRQKCRDAIADADLAAISTLHGFASRILGEFAVAAGLPPQVRVLDEVSSQLASEERWERFVDGLYEDPALEELLTRAALLGVELEPSYKGQATLKDVAAQFNQNWDRLEALATADQLALGPIAYSNFDAAVDQLAALQDQCSDPSDKFYQHITNTLLPTMLAVRNEADPRRKLRLLSGRPAWGRGSGGKNANWGNDVKAAKGLVDEVNEAASAVAEKAAQAVLGLLLQRIAKEVLDAADNRRREGGLEFHDLLVLAREMLRSNPEARATLHRRYTHVLLDEFQDTDPIQIELASLIAASVSGSDPPSWDKLEIQPGRLFFVGDPKQSIYRFRRADIELFLTARSRFGPGGSHAQLTTNFRTVEPILSWVNAWFEGAMAEEQPGKQPKYVKLEAYRSAKPGVDHRPVLLGGPHPDPKVKAAELREAEAADVAATAAEIRDFGADWPVMDEQSKDRKEWRPAKLSDVTVLIPTRTSLPYLRAALDNVGVLYRIATGTLVYDTQEVRDTLAAVRAIDDPTDTLSLVAALRSPLYGCSDVDLFDFTEAGGRWDLRRDPLAGLPPEHPVVGALSHLRSLWEERWWLTPSGLLDRLLRERRAFLLAFGDPRPVDVWRRLRFVLDQARAFEEAGGGGLRAFTQWATLQGADLARVHEPLLPETDEEAMRILTIHGAKGLEFPITILSGMTTKPSGARRGVRVIWPADGPPEVKLRSDLQTKFLDARASLEDEMDQHERLRLAYVATTRAKDHLVVSCHHKVGKGEETTYGGKIWSFFAERQELWRTLDLALPAVGERLTPGGSPVGQTLPLAFDDRDRWLQARETLIQPQRQPVVLSATGVAKAALALPEPPNIEGGDDDNADLPSQDGVPQRRKGRQGTAIGSAVHAVLQLANLANPGDLDELVRSQCEVEAIPEHAETVSKLVGSALDSQAVKLARANDHHKELFVTAPVGGRVIEGYIDLLIDTADGLVVVDYKTDSVRTEAEIEAKLAAYELQGASYAVAIEEVTGRPVVDCLFVFCRASGAIERSVTNLATAKKRVRATLAVP